VTSLAVTPSSRPEGQGGGFRVIPSNAGGEKIYVVVTAVGVPLYSFSDLHSAVSEAATLNAR
jgi:hypothetical protein